MIVQITAYLACAGTPGMCFSACCKYLRIIVRLLGIVLADISQYGSFFINRRKCHTLNCYVRGYCVGFSGLVACSHAGFARTDLSIARKILYVAICVCNVSGFRDWSRAGMLVSPEQIFGSKGSHFTLLFACFGFSGLLACSHAGFARTGLKQN